MTKTTSYEISKKLKEAGFEAETEYYWHAINNKIELHHVARAGLGDVKAYDLETILQALPENIAYKDFRPWLLMDKKRSIYYCFYDQSFDGLYAKIEENESLADIAGKMWLLLKEKGMV